MKDGNCHQVLELLDSPEGNDFTASQEGCERLEWSVDQDNPNQILDRALEFKGRLDVGFEATRGERQQWFQQATFGIDRGKRIEIKFSEVNKSRRNDVPKHAKRILEEHDKVKHLCGTQLDF